MSSPQRVTELKKALRDTLTALEAVNELDREMNHQVLTSRVSRLCAQARASARLALNDHPTPGGDDAATPPTRRFT